MLPNNSHGRSIRLFLAGGSPAGLIIAEIVNWTGKAILVPRTELATFLKRPESKKAGVYILSGPDPDDFLRPSVYVGESEEVGTRLKQHDSDEKKNFFDKAVIFVSKDENLTKAHAKHLEVHLTKRIKAAKRATATNASAPSGAALPEADVSDMEYFLDQVEIVVPVLGLDILRPIAAPVGSNLEPTKKKTAAVGEATTAMTVPTYTLSIGLVKATAFEQDGEFIVEAGSIGRDTEAPTMPSGYRNLRAQLKADGALKLADDKPGGEELFVFTRHVPFSSPTAAACVLYGTPISGPQSWHLKDSDQTYAEHREKILSEAEAAAEESAAN